MAVDVVDALREALVPNDAENEAEMRDCDRGEPSTLATTTAAFTRQSLERAVEISRELGRPLELARVFGGRDALFVRACFPLGSVSTQEAHASLAALDRGKHQRRVARVVGMVH